MSTNKKTWILTFASSEAAINLYSILLAFQQSEGSGIINREAVKCVNQWLRKISRQIPNIDKLANDPRGPFRQRDISPIMASLELDSRERSLMLYICKIIYKQLAAPKGRLDWIKNQSQADYDYALENYKTWISVLENENASQAGTS